MTHSPDRQIQSFRTAQSTGSISWQSLAFSQTSGPDVVVTTGVVVTSSSIHSPLKINLENLLKVKIESRSILNETVAS